MAGNGEWQRQTMTTTTSSARLNKQTDCRTDGWMDGKTTAADIKLNVPFSRYNDEQPDIYPAKQPTSHPSIHPSIRLYFNVRTRALQSAVVVVHGYK